MYTSVFSSDTKEW